MNKDVEIGQINELKFYLAWDYVKEVCNEAVRKENELLRKFADEFNALEVAKENKKLKTLIKKCRGCVEVQFENAMMCKEWGDANHFRRLLRKIQKVLEEKK